MRAGDVHPVTRASPTCMRRWRTSPGAAATQTPGGIHPDRRIWRRSTMPKVAGRLSLPQERAMTTTIESIRLRALGRSRDPGRLEQIQTSVRESVQGAVQDSARSPQPPASAGGCQAPAPRLPPGAADRTGQCRRRLAGQVAGVAGLPAHGRRRQAAAAPRRASCGGRWRAGRVGGRRYGGRHRPRAAYRKRPSRRRRSPRRTRGRRGGAAAPSRCDDGRAALLVSDRPPLVTTPAFCFRRRLRRAPPRSDPPGGATDRPGRHRLRPGSSPAGGSPTGAR